MIRHVLLVKFKETVEPSQLQTLWSLFTDIPQKVAGVASVEWGENDSPEGLNRGYTHCIFMTFDDEAGRQNYLPHPEHDALKDVFVPLIEDIVVFDYPVS